jgi:epoxyqueuosine reductase
VLDSTRCLSYWTQAPHAIPEPYLKELGASVYGCDVCQDVCPWNRGVEKRRADRQLADNATPTVSLVEWLERDGVELVAEFDRLYVPRNDPRWLKRNALVALGNTGTSEHLDVLGGWAGSDDEVLRQTAQWAQRRIAERTG